MNKIIQRIALICIIVFDLHYSYYTLTLPLYSKHIWETRTVVAALNAVTLLVATVEIDIDEIQSLATACLSLLSRSQASNIHVSQLFIISSKTNAV